MNVLDRFAAAGVAFRLDGERVVAKLSVPITDELREQMKAARDEIRDALESIESRRRRLLAMLAERPGQKCAVIYEPDASDKYDVLIVAIPEATFEVRVPKPADSLEFVGGLMKMLDRHAGPGTGSLPVADSTRPA